jgi:hypothetical protein
MCRVDEAGEVSLFKANHNTTTTVTKACAIKIKITLTRVVEVEVEDEASIFSKTKTQRNHIFQTPSELKRSQKLSHS